MSNFKIGLILSKIYKSSLKLKILDNSLIKLIIIVKKAIIYLKLYGFSLFLSKVLEKTGINYNKKIILAPQFGVNGARIKKVLSDSIISIVIPTKNAGDEFRKLLIILNQQIGIKTLEIIIVDSGSTDNTLLIAQEFGAKVLLIPEKDFSHSYARNLGAENSIGNYLLFLTQDALPSSEFWIYQLLAVIKKYKVTAVSCKEEMRHDADLFYRVISWYHWRFMELNRGDRIVSKPIIADHVSLRKNGQLSDMACLIRKTTFLAYKFRYNYAEDS